MDARKARYGAADLAGLFRGGRKLLIAKQKQIVEIDLGRAPGRAELELALGPSGNLRAPTARIGRDWLVGFGDEAWRRLLG